VLVVSIGATVRAAQDTAPMPVWTLDPIEQIVSTSVSSSGRCVAIATVEEVRVVSAEGRDLWRWEYRATNRFVSVNRVAISPSCRFIVTVGDPSYRYMWIVHQDGRRRSTGTRATPIGIAISHDGALIALGTGANEVRIYTADGALKSRTRLTAGCCANELIFSADDQNVFVTRLGTAAVSAAGQLKWSQWDFSMWAAPNGHTFVGFWEPPHGPGVPFFTVRDENGRALWSRFGGPAITDRTGEVILGAVNDSQRPADQDPFNPNPATVTMLDRSGRLLATLPGPGEPIGISDDGLRILMRSDRLSAVSRDGSVVWSVPLDRFPTIIHVPQMNAVVISSREEVDWFALPW
jgi:hypothetical protein